VKKERGREEAEPSRALEAELEGLMDEMARLHERLLEDVGAHREALRRADGGGVARAVEAQGATLREIAGLEGRRRDVVAAACGTHPALAGKRSGPVTLGDVAAALPEPAKGRLSRKAVELRGLIGRVHERTATVRAATTSLLAHLEGLVRQVGRQLSHAGTYTRRGFVERGGVVVSALDLRS